MDVIIRGEGQVLIDQCNLIASSRVCVSAGLLSDNRIEREVRGSPRRPLV